MLSPGTDGVSVCRSMRLAGEASVDPPVVEGPGALSACGVGVPPPADVIPAREDDVEESPL